MRICTHLFDVRVGDSVGFSIIGVMVVERAVELGEGVRGNVLIFKIGSKAPT